MTNYNAEAKKTKKFQKQLGKFETQSSFTSRDGLSFLVLTQRNVLYRNFQAQRVSLQARSQVAGRILSDISLFYSKFIWWSFELQVHYELRCFR